LLKGGVFPHSTLLLVNLESLSQIIPNYFIPNFTEGSLLIGGALSQRGRVVLDNLTENFVNNNLTICLILSLSYNS
jgi:hypothetical protein